MAALGALLGGVRLAERPPRVAGPALPSATAIAAAKANTAAAAAAAAAREAQTAGRNVQAQLVAARQAAKQVGVLAAPALARQPSAQDPGKTLALLQSLQSRVAGAVRGIGRDVAAAEQGAAVAATVPAAAGRAESAAAAAKSALAGAQGAAGQIEALLAPAQHVAATWRQIHTEPAGSLGLTTRDPPATWAVHGCEVLTVKPGGAGQAVGLVGPGGAGGPVGDIVTLVRDATDGNADWPVADCAGLRAAMTQTRTGDRLTVAYEQRASMDLVLGFWLSHTGTAVLRPGGAARPVCPGTLKGRTGPGGAVPLTIAVTGPAGTRQGVAVTLTPAAEASFFPDALLRALGYKPYGSEAGSGLAPGSRASVYLYDLIGSSLTVADGGQPAALADGVLTVLGIPGARGASLGAGVLGRGARLAVRSGAWALTPPCH